MPCHPRPPGTAVSVEMAASCVSIALGVLTFTNTVLTLTTARKEIDTSVLELRREALGLCEVLDSFRDMHVIKLCAGHGGMAVGSLKKPRKLS